MECGKPARTMMLVEQQTRLLSSEFLRTLGVLAIFTVGIVTDSCRAIDKNSHHPILVNI